MPKLYTATYETNLRVENVNTEIPILLPDMPPESEMYNYGIPEEDQVWKAVKIPPDYRRWPWQKKKEWADEMWHRRWNGEWWLIKGKPVYLTGTAFLFFNFWKLSKSKLPDFKMQCVWWFQVMRHVELDKNVFGCMEIKPRRAHATEMSLCWMWDTVTKYRDSKGGIMSKADDEAESAFDRLVFSAMEMHPIFKPKNTGSDRPQAQIEYQYPARKIGTRNVNEVHEDHDTPALHSKIWFEPTVEGKFDGEKMRALVFDELGKIKVSKMNVKYQWGIMRECLSLDVMTNIIGKAILPSTIEEMDDGKSIAIVQDFWDESNPKRLDKVGRTQSGLIRMFRSYWQIAKPDKWGYPDADDARRVRNAQLQALEEAGKHEEAADLRRKFPETVEEALAPPATEASIPTELIDKARKYLDEAPKNLSTRAVQGTLHWKGGEFGGNVMWTPDPNGKWFISRHPDKPNNRIILQNNKAAPGNTGEFAMGADPIDSVKPRKGGSDGAFCVGIMHDFVRDADMQFDADDVLLDHGMYTDACACDYASRPKMPEEFYEDALMTAIYFGCQMLVETNKPGLVNWGFEKGFGAYFSQKPVNADVKWMSRMRSDTIGISAVGATIDNYYRHLKSHVIRRWRNYTHPRLLADLRKLTPDNRTERDLSVAWGWCLTLMYGLALKKKRDRSKPDIGASRKSFPLSTYK